ncbi:MAG: M55 family metallopeptidase [Candidatus Aminicenantaceae bacterium]
MKHKNLVVMLAVFFMITAGQSLSAEEGLKVFISVDMEGVCGVIHWEEVSRDGKDYGLFRRLMTLETNAAVEGAMEAGAGKIVVRDSHGSARNILPDDLHPAAELIRDWSGSPFGMMEGVDETFDAVIFIGYHAGANVPDAVLKHTMTGTIYNVTLNGMVMPEAGINGFIAGNYGVPVVMIAGDKAICDQAGRIFQNVATAPVKEGIGTAARMMHPEKARELIKNKTREALSKLDSFKPWTLTAPYTMEVTFKNEERAENASWIPGAERTGNTSVSFTSSDWVEILKFFKFAR